MTKCLNARPKTKEKGIDIILMYIEVEKQDVVQVCEQNTCQSQFSSDIKLVPSLNWSPCYTVPLMSNHTKNKIHLWPCVVLVYRVR